MDYYKDEKISISFNHSIHTLVINFKGFLTSRDYRNAFLKLLQIMKTQRALNIIADTTDMKLICTDDQQWTIRYVLPKAYKSGCKALAVIPSKDYFNRISADEILDTLASSSFPFKVTSSKEQAEQWISTLS